MKTKKLLLALPMVTILAGCSAKIVGYKDIFRPAKDLDQEVKDYVLNAPETKEFLKHVIEYLDFYLAALRKNDRHHASIGIACSGGQHRSVCIAEYLAEHYSKQYFTTVHHKNLPNKLD